MEMFQTGEGLNYGTNMTGILELLEMKLWAVPLCRAGPFLGTASGIGERGILCYLAPNRQ